MRKSITILPLLILIFSDSIAQRKGKIFSGTFKQGSTANSFIVALKPNVSFSGSITNVQFTIQVPEYIQSQHINIDNNLLSDYIPTSSYQIITSHENGYTNYLFNAILEGMPPFEFKSGSEIEVIEISLNGIAEKWKDIRLAHLANGGLQTRQMCFYVEVDGNDNTNYDQMFYGREKMNSGKFSSYSYVPVIDNEYINPQQSTIAQTSVNTVLMKENRMKSDIQSSLLANARIYPNPADNKIIVELSNFPLRKKTILTITDETGRILILEHIKTSIEKSNISVNISHLPSGLYFLTLPEYHIVQKFTRK